ncbi:MAG: DNA cytosine methyltransferase [Nostoc sp. ChiQUE01a]|nr:DNA cytosine methyltransferase [Nostoc sp. ChiQUE01a]
MFTLENVPRYQSSQSFAIILDALESLGYKVNYSVVNIGDYGLPQARRSSTASGYSILPLIQYAIANTLVTPHGFLSLVVLNVVHSF